MYSTLSAQSSAQGGPGMPPVLSGGSSGLSSPLRESGHLESLLEVNSRVEAAMDRARAQLQAISALKCYRLPADSLSVWLDMSDRLCISSLAVYGHD